MTRPASAGVVVVTFPILRCLLQRIRDRGGYCGAENVLREMDVYEQQEQSAQAVEVEINPFVATLVERAAIYAKTGSSDALDQLTEEARCVASLIEGRPWPPAKAQAVEGPAPLNPSSEMAEALVAYLRDRAKWNSAPGPCADAYCEDLAEAADALAAAVRTQQAPKGSEVPAAVCPECKHPTRGDDYWIECPTGSCRCRNKWHGEAEPKGSEGRDQIGDDGGDNAATRRGPVIPKQGPAEQPAPPSSLSPTLAALDRAMGLLRDANAMAGKAAESPSERVFLCANLEQAATRALTAWDAWREAAKMEGGGADG